MDTICWHLEYKVKPIRHALQTCKYYDKLITITTCTYIYAWWERTLLNVCIKMNGRESVRVACVWVRVECQTELAIEDWHSGIWWWCAGSRCARPTETRMRTALPAVASVWVRPCNGLVFFSSHSHVSWQVTFLFLFSLPVILMCPDE